MKYIIQCTRYTYATNTPWITLYYTHSTIKSNQGRCRPWRSAAFARGLIDETYSNLKIYIFEPKPSGYVQIQPGEVPTLEVSCPCTGDRRRCWKTFISIISLSDWMETIQLATLIQRTRLPIEPYPQSDSKAQVHRTRYVTRTGMYYNTLNILRYTPRILRLTISTYQSIPICPYIIHLFQIILHDENTTAR
jgi:hypothetical protein